MCKTGNNINTKSLLEVHKLLMDALRHREQEIMRYIAILAPAIGGFIWLLIKREQNPPIDDTIFTIGAGGILLLLFIGAFYSLALGYNYRYITLQIAKIENHLSIEKVMLKGWPKRKKDFLERYKLNVKILSKVLDKFDKNYWCTPPEIIKVFWYAFLITIIAVTAASCFVDLNIENKILIVVMGLLSCLIGYIILPIHYGKKFYKMCNLEEF